MSEKAEKQISIWLTVEQHAALMAIAPRYGRSEFIREAIQRAVERAGGEWPDNMPSLGKALNPSKLV